MKLYIYFAILVFFVCHVRILNAQTIIAIQDFEASPATPTWSYTNTGGAASINTGSGDTPANQRIRTGSRSFQINNASSTLTFADVSTSSYNNISVIVRISSTSVSPGNGADGGDYLRLFVALNGGSFAANTSANANIEVTGNNNARWGYNTSGVSTPSSTNVTVSGTSGTNASPIYSTLTITIPNGTSSVALRINALNNNNDEIWNIDDVVIQGDLVSSPLIEIQSPVSTVISCGATVSMSAVVGASSTQTIRVRNAGAGTLTSTSVSSPTSPFSVNTTSNFSLSAISTTDFIITFTPTATGTATSSITFTTNSTSNATCTINLSGTGTASSSSNIIENTSFGYASNIDYRFYQASDITAANSLEAGQFILRDGGGSADADNLPTTLTALTLSLSNSSNIRRVALYDGSTELGEVAGAASVSFTGLNISAADGASKTFSVRVTFNASVTDRQNFQFTITSATASSAGSNFAAANAGGASSSVVSNTNRIQVTADRLAFVQQPSTTTVGMAISPSVTVSANDDFGNRDIDYVSNVTLSLVNGCGAANNAVVAAVSGLATFASLSITRAQYSQLLATSGSLMSATSNFFQVNPTATIAARQDFDGTSPVWGYTTATTDNTGLCAGGSGIGVISTTNSYGVTGNAFTKSHSVNNPSGEQQSETILTFDNITLPPASANIKITFSVQSVNLGSSGSGMDSGGYPNCNDRIMMESSIDGGSTYTTTFINRSTGGDQTWAYGNSPRTYNYNDGTDEQVNCGSYTINFPDGTTNIRFRLRLRNNRTNEIWAIDNVLLEATTPSDTKHYRTVGSGDWRSACFWQVADDKAFTTGVADADMPPSLNSLSVTIRNGHTININQSQGATDLTVDAGGILRLNGGSVLTIDNDVSGADMTINGQYEDNATSAGGISFSPTTATWQLGSAATFIKTSNSAAVPYRDRYQGGMSTIPATAHWILRYNGGNNPTITAVNSHYPNLTIESTSGVWNGSAVGSSFTGSSSGTIIKGNFDVGGTGSGTVIFYGQNTNNTLDGTSLEVQGDMIVRAGSTFTNAGTSNGTGVTVNGNLTVNGTLTLNASGTGLLSMRGGVNTSISGTGTFNLHNLRVNKTNSSTRTIMNVGFAVPGTVTIASGDLDLNGNVLNLGTTGVLNESRSTSDVVDDYTRPTFPTLGGYINATGRSLVGTDIAGLGISISNSSAGLVDLRRYNYRFGTGSNGSIHKAFLVTPSVGASAATLSIDYSPQDLTGTPLTDATPNFRLYRYDGSAWQKHLSPAAVSACHNTSTKSVFGDDISAFSPWTAAPENIALPLLWLRGNLTREQTAYLHWLSPVGLEGASITLERSSDGKMFESIWQTDKLSQQYFIDEHFSQFAYYRLRLLRGGEIRWSNLVYLTGTDHRSQPWFSPNPITNPDEILLRLPDNTTYHLIITDLQGKLLSHTQGTAAHLQDVLRSKIALLPAATYILRIDNKQGDIWQSKFTKN